jgi:hypothetical protein
MFTVGEESNELLLQFSRLAQIVNFQNAVGPLTCFHVHKGLIPLEFLIKEARALLPFLLSFFDLRLRLSIPVHQSGTEMPPKYGAFTVSTIVLPDSLIQGPFLVDPNSCYPLTLALAYFALFIPEIDPVSRNRDRGFPVIRWEKIQPLMYILAKLLPHGVHHYFTSHTPQKYALPQVYVVSLWLTAHSARGGERPLSHAAVPPL